MTGFDTLPLHATIKKSLREVFKYETMSTVQEATLPASLAGLDVFAKAKTGSGKTLSFLLPIVDRLLRTRGSPVRALVISPTRELAAQSKREAAKLIGNSLSIQLVIGGEDMKKQSRGLLGQSCDIVFATPGRLADHLKRTTGFADRLKNVEVLVLDECDRLLDGGFRKEVEYISRFLSAKKQTLLFTATVPNGVKEIAAKIMRPGAAAKVIDASSGSGTVSETASHTRIVQEYLCVPSRLMIAHLHRVIRYKIAEPGYRIICFFVNVGIAQFMAALFRATGIPILEMHSDLSQSERNRNAAKFAASSGHVVFASDVLARGVDYPDVTLVIQFGYTDVVSYEHRVGRTGRAGKSGEALIILGEEEREMVRQLVAAKMPIHPASAKSVITNGAVSETAVRRSSALIEVIEGLPKNRDMRKLAQRAFRKMMGSYASKKNFLKLKVDGLFKICGDIVMSAGLDELPVIQPEMMKKMGLKGGW